MSGFTEREDTRVYCSSPLISEAPPSGAVGRSPGGLAGHTHIQYAYLTVFRGCGRHARLCFRIHVSFPRVRHARASLRLHHLPFVQLSLEDVNCNTAAGSRGCSHCQKRHLPVFIDLSLENGV